MADAKPKHLPVATALPPKQPPRGIVIDPVVLAVGGVAALLGVGVLAVFLWMVPSAAARESVSACRGLGGYSDFDGQPNHASPLLCPGQQPCSLPIANGLPAPDFTALDLSGKSVKLSDFRGKVVLLNFWASWCNVCKAEKPSLAEMAHDLGSDDFVVITLVSDKTWPDALVAVMESLAPNMAPPLRDANGEISMSAMRTSFEQALPDGIPFKAFLDPPKGDDNLGPITQSWGIKAVPESALIDRKGNIRAYFVNKRDWESPVAKTCLRSVIDE